MPLVLEPCSPVVVGRVLCHDCPMHVRVETLNITSERRRMDRPALPLPNGELEREQPRDFPSVLSY